MFLVTINVHYLESVVNPEAERLSEFLKRQKRNEFESIHVGKNYQFKVHADDLSHAHQLADALAQEVLVNDAMQDFTISVEEV